MIPNNPKLEDLLIRKKTERTVFLETVTIIADTIAIKEKI